MRRFIVEVVLDAIVLVVIVLLLGAISVGQPFPFGGNGDVPIVTLVGAGPIGFLTWAAVLVLVNRFARRVVVLSEYLDQATFSCSEPGGSALWADLKKARRL